MRKISALLQSLLKHPNRRLRRAFAALAGEWGWHGRRRTRRDVRESHARLSSAAPACCSHCGMAGHLPLPGGTADTLLRYLGVRTERDVADEDSLTFVDASDETESSASWVYWIPARRRDDDQAPDLKQPVFLSGVGDNVLQMHSGIPAPFQHQLAELDDYNREFARLTEQQGAGPARFPAGLVAGGSAAARPLGAQRYRRGVRKGRCIRRVLSASFGPPVQVLQHLDVRDGGWRTSVTNASTRSPLLLLLLSAVPGFRGGYISRAARQALVWPTPHVSGDRRDAACQVLPASVRRRSSGQGTRGARRSRESTASAVSDWSAAS